MLFTVTVLASPEQISVALGLVKLLTSGIPDTVMASVLPLLAFVVQLFNVKLLIVTVVVPALLNVGVANVPLLPELTVILTFVALWALSPVNV